MRALFFLALALAGIWLWRSLNTAAKKPLVDPEVTRYQPAEMVQCLHCGVHLPAAEAIMGSRGSYCSQAHLQQSES